MGKVKNIDISVIIPVYNAEEYLPACIESVFRQGSLRLELIIVNDGSTDGSEMISDHYANRDNRIKVIHQENRGACAAINAGLELAQGEFIAFLDNDDWVKENSLFELYREASIHQADLVKGNALFFNQDGTMYSNYESVPKDIMNIPLSGKDCFINLVKARAYAPMVWNYIYSRKFLEKIQARFVEGVIGDEIWTPIVICQAEKMVVVDVDFYYYRQRDGSFIHSLKLNRHLDALFQITDQLMDFSERFDFSSEDREFKSWWYVNVFRLYFIAFESLSKIKDSSYLVPKHHLDRFWRDDWQMTPEARKICLNYFQIAKDELKKYTDWRISDWVACVAYQIRAGKKLMLIYNTMSDEDLSLKLTDIPGNWVITTDRRYVQQADVVVFHLPNLQQGLEQNLHKRKGQIWVAWYLVSLENYPCFKAPEFIRAYDLWMSYKQDADIVYPHYRCDDLDLYTQQVTLNFKQNNTCMCMFNQENENFQEEYLKELMEYIEIDLYDNKQQSTNFNTEKLDYLSKYKFVIAFENTIDDDYVTDIFFDPLIAGSVPIYLGAPNIEDFAPGDNCFVDVRKFENTQSLAHFINACYEDEHLYDKFFDWKIQPLKESFLQKIEIQKEHPLVRLCRKVEELNTFA